MDGAATAPAIPCTALPRTKICAVGATPATNEAAAKAPTPVRKTRRRPKMSPSRAPSSSRPPNASVYAFCTHDSPELEKCSDSRIFGKAVTMTDVSRVNISWHARSIASTTLGDDACREDVDFTEAAIPVERPALLVVTEP